MKYYRFKVFLLDAALFVVLAMMFYWAGFNWWYVLLLPFVLIAPNRWWNYHVLKKAQSAKTSS